MMQKQFFIFITCILCLSFFGKPIKAQIITTIQDINFGEAVIFENDTQYEILVNANGSYSSDPQFSFVDFPQRGEYFVSGLPNNVLILNINVTVDQQLQGLGEDFIIDNFDIDAPTNASPSGDLTIFLGARLRTTGSGISYNPSTTFNSIMTLDVIY